jgi:hypothetical protein
MESRRLNNLKEDIFKLLTKPTTTNQLLQELKQEEQYEFISWASINSRLDELEKEKKIKSNKSGRTKIYYT